VRVRKQRKSVERLLDRTRQRVQRQAPEEPGRTHVRAGHRERVPARVQPPLSELHRRRRLGPRHRRRGGGLLAADVPPRRRLHHRRADKGVVRQHIGPQSGTQIGVRLQLEFARHIQGLFHIHGEGEQTIGRHLHGRLRHGDDVHAVKRGGERPLPRVQFDALPRRERHRARARRSVQPGLEPRPHPDGRIRQLCFAKLRIVKPALASG